MNKLVCPRSTAWRLARALCRWMPPILAQRLRTAVYSQTKAFAENAAFTVPACTGSVYSGRTGDFHGYPFSVHGYYEWRNWAVALALCREGDTIIEVGANVGTETVGFRDIVGARGKLVAVEPFPDNLRVLRGLVTLNGWTNVEIFPVAIGDKAGTISFMPPPDAHASGVGHIANQGDRSSAQTISVECTTLDLVAARIGAPRAIFCDAEGAELLILKGARSYLREHQPALVIEASPKLLKRAGTSLDELHGCLHDMGYKSFVIGRFGVSPVRNSAATNAGNWLCLPSAQIDQSRRCASMIRKCAVLPCFPRINPLCR